jgi:hypothetical protein
VSAPDACLEGLSKEEVGLRAVALAACCFVADVLSKREGKTVPVWRYLIIASLFVISCLT